MPQSSKRLGWLIGLPLLAALECSFPARAQNAPADSPPADAAAQSPKSSNQTATVSTIPVEVKDKSPQPAAVEDPTVVRLDEVVVTATKRPQSVRSIPATIAAFTGEDLERKGIQSVDEIVKLVPGVTITDDGANPKRITIRGISADIGTNLTTGVLIGDVPFSDPYLPRVALDPNPFDLATVEVLKGPQGTLFGGTGLNGSIRYVPEPPKFDETELKYFVQYKDYGKQGGRAPVYGAALNLPLAQDKLALRLVGFDRREPGYVDDTQAGVEDINRLKQHGYRAILAWLPTAAWKISLTHLAQHTRVADTGFTDNFEGRLERGNTPRPSPATTDYNLSNLGLEYGWPWGTVVSQSSRIEKTLDGLFDSSRFAANGREPVAANAAFNFSRGLIQELRLLSNADAESPWKWLGGAVVYQVDQFDCLDAPAGPTPLLSPLPAPLPLPRTGAPTVAPAPCAQNEKKIGAAPVITHAVTQLRLTETALFGEVSRKFLERFEATAGARLYHVASKGHISLGGAIFATQPSQEREPNLKERGINPKFALSYTYSKQLLLYTSANRGFRFGGVQAVGDTPTTDVPDSFKADSLWNYELGVRSSWLDRSLLADVSLYYIDWKNPQLLQTAGSSAFFGNVGGVRGQGVETTLQYRPPFLGGLSLGVSAAYTDTVTTEAFTTFAGTATQPGTKWPLAPEWQTSTTLAYTAVLGAWSLGPALIHTFSSTAFNNLDHTAKVFGYHTLDFQFNLSNILHAWIPEVNLTLNNLTDTRGKTNVTVSNLAPGAEFKDVTYLPPRAVTLRLGGRF